ncbi:tetratricopeptide repeat protein [Campylobacter canadensis]|uniref:ATP-dependent nuclease subunit B n=1 Tax=Campylobacter canadensis TaxID=449520 RepID=A0ABS7WQ34_9BACT|nr:hypothetical protein [Campylobacter canadensis]MBZ7986879.1 hypothetical protein [Campylobacter canadensis]MBZ7994200.1 hypothetical protein [Campylobacter canadensis]MBZ7995807.1 hypothetical protein [Campylobacter canadensis]MBZ7997916.1 hypothetical protein [Campylobacter canadensis]MBZ7999532.1 hypothetical protein [Campylobacter canadensis]
MYRYLFLIVLVFSSLFADNLSIQETKDKLILDALINEDDKEKAFESYKQLFLLTNEQVYLEEALNYAVNNESLNFLKNNVENKDLLEQIDIRFLFLNKKYDECLKKVVAYTNKKESRLFAFFYIRISFLLNKDIESMKKYVEGYFKKYNDVEVITFFVAFLANEENVDSKALLAFVKKYEEDIYDKLFLLKVYVNFSDLKVAEELVNKMEDEYKDNKEFIYVKNCLYYELSKEKKDYKKAVEYLDLINDYEQDKIAYYSRIFKLVSQCVENKELSSAAMILEKYKIRNSILADIYVSLNEFSKASELYYELSLKSDDNKMNYLALSYLFSYYDNKDTYKDYFKLDEIIAKGGVSAELINNYAYYLVDEKIDIEKAYKLISKIMQDEQNQKNPYYLDTYAWVLYHKKDCKKAYEIIQKAISLDEKYANEDEAKEHLLRIENCKN